MRQIDSILSIHSDRGPRGLPLDRVYKHLFDRELSLRAYGKIYRNFGSMTPGSTEETVDGMCIQKIDRIIALLKLGAYRWTPVRRTNIPKGNGKPGTRPLGIPTWSNKLVHEALRLLLEPYYEQRFSDHSHGFRPDRGCHTALLEISRTWKGTSWFIEGDIKGAFDNVDHEILLSIIRRDIHDDRLVKLIGDLLKSATAAEVLNYFCGHQDRLGYAARLRRGQVIGSGLVEGTIKQRVNIRMKRSGARWLPQHAGPFVELLAMADGPEWSEFWACMAA